MLFWGLFLCSSVPKPLYSILCHLLLNNAAFFITHRIICYLFAENIHFAKAFCAFDYNALCYHDTRLKDIRQDISVFCGYSWKRSAKRAWL